MKKGIKKEKEKKKRRVASQSSEPDGGIKTENNTS